MPSRPSSGRASIPERSLKRRFKTATDVCYDNPAFFRRLFKRCTGLTPGAYRRMFKPISDLPAPHAGGRGEAPAPYPTRSGLRALAFVASAVARPGPIRDVVVFPSPAGHSQRSR